METKDDHKKFMRRAIDLAKQGLGAASPNPLVGCVIVRNGQIIGEGYHQKYGGPHAEVNAVDSVSDKALLRGATAYVTLEPCSHHGKTPPCADLLVSSGIPDVFIAHEDPHPLVDGGGIKKLKEAGIQVEVGLLREEYTKVNRRFFTAVAHNRPYVILKWAQTADGFIAKSNFDSKWISNLAARQLVHKWRSEEDAILVGKNTAKYDDPTLNVRHWHGRNPIRVVIDIKLSLPQDLKLFDGSIRTYVVNSEKERSDGETHWMQVDAANWEREMLSRLRQMEIGSMIVEGGAQTLQRFIDLKLWDEARVFTAPTSFGEGIAAPKLPGNLVGQSDVEGNTLSIYQKQ